MNQALIDHFAAAELVALLNQNLWAGNSLRDVLIALSACLAVLFVALLARQRLTRHLQRLAPQTETTLDDWLAEVLPCTRTLLVLALALWCGAQLLHLSPAHGRGIDRVAILALLLQGGLWLNRSILFWVHQRFENHGDAANPGASGAERLTGPLLGFLLRTAMWAMVLLLLLDNLGFNVTALIASLGIGGIAVALAVQNILGDLFASLSIAIDQPFVIGDFIVVGEFSGTIEHVGLKTTRVRSLSGEQIIFANADLLGSRIRNYKRMQERRVLFAFGVTYETSTADLEQIPELVRTVIAALPGVRFDRAHFKSFGPASLDFEVVFYVLDADYRHYMDQQQAINLGIARALEQAGIDFAYPTQTLHFGSPLRVRHEAAAGLSRVA